jgi:hypothetical protein
MKDTPPRIERKFRALLSQRTSEERLKMGCSMHATAQALAKAYLSQQHPGADLGEMKRLLFVHFYRTDFEAEERKRIASALSRRGQRAGVLEEGKPTTPKPSRPRMPATVKSSGANAVREKGENYGAMKKRKAKQSRSPSG